MMASFRLYGPTGVGRNTLKWRDRPRHERQCVDSPAGSSFVLGSGDKIDAARATRCNQARRRSSIRFHHQGLAIEQASLEAHCRRKRHGVVGSFAGEIETRSAMGRILLHHLVGRHRAPKVGGVGIHWPDFRFLRIIPMPRPRIEVAECLILHLVELGEEFRDQAIWAAMISEEVVTDSVPSWAP